MRNRVLALALLALCAYANDASACSCVRPGPPETHLASSELVFTGTVVDVEDRFGLLQKIWHFLQTVTGHEPDFDMDEYERRYGFEYTFQVDRMWRGTPAREVRVITGRGGGDCGFCFRPGRTYLVYADCSREGDCFTSICGRTAPTEHAAEDLRFLATQATLRVP